MNYLTKVILLYSIFLFIPDIRAESPEAEYYEMNIPPAALERCAKNGDPDCMFDFGNCLYDGICKGIGIKNKDLIKRDAYIFGISDYDDDELDLQQPINDAIDMDKYLKENGYNTNLFKNSGLGDFSIFKLRASQANYNNSDYDRNDVLFYYSGHGVNFRGKNYIIPKDFIPSDDNILSLQSLNEIIEVIEKNYNGIKVLIFDACRSEGNSEESAKSSLPLYDSKDGRLKFNIPYSGLAPIKAGPNTYIIYASSPGEVSLALRGMRNSVFTAAFIDSLKNDSGQDIDKIMMETRETVMQLTKSYGEKQVPWNESSLNESYYISSREINKSEKELGIYWISKAAAKGNEPALSMMAAFYCEGETSIPKNPAKGKKIIDKLLATSEDPTVLQITNYFKDTCGSDNVDQIMTPELFYKGIADNHCAINNCLEFIGKALSKSTVLTQDQKMLFAYALVTISDEPTVYYFSLYQALQEDPGVIDYMYSEISAGTFDEAIEQYKETPNHEAIFTIVSIHYLSFEGFKESLAAGEDFRNN
jgi:hypothetical protein